MVSDFFLLTVYSIPFNMSGFIGKVIPYYDCKSSHRLLHVALRLYDLILAYIGFVIVLELEENHAGIKFL
jgi:hypothetical protein